MSSVVGRIQRKLRETFGDDAVVWLDRSYVFDWCIVTAAWIIGWWIKWLPPYEREFSANDPLIAHSHKKNQISGNTNMMVALFLPAVTVLVIGTLRVSAMEIHHGLLSLWAGSGFTSLIVEFLKNRVGRLRPDFLARCKWEEASKACRGKIDTVVDGRRSFPSGHTSAAWAGMTFLALFLAGNTRAWCLSNPLGARTIRNSRLIRLCLTLAPIAYATWVGVSRIEDYRHHKEDVIVGSLIGLCTSATCYLIYWPNPFNLQQSVLDRGAARPRNVYGENGVPRMGRDYDYELAGVEHATETV